MMLLILILSEKNIFQNKLKHLLVIKTNIFRIQAYDSIMCRYFCLVFINFMLAGKTLHEFTNLCQLILKEMMIHFITNV